MPVNPVQTMNSVAISNTQESRDDRQRDQENKKASKNKKGAQPNQARPDASTIDNEAEQNLEAQIVSQPVDTEKVLELLAQKKEPVVTKAQIIELSKKRVKKTAQKKIDKIY